MPVPDPVPGLAATTVLTGADTAGPGASLAGGSSLVLFRDSPHVREAWELLEYLSAPAQQATFYRLAEDLPPRMSVWRDPALAGDPYMRAFATQLRHVRATPPVPEWDQITTVIADHGEAVARGAATTDASLTSLDQDVGRLLAKRRWVLAHESSPMAMGQ